MSKEVYDVVIFGAGPAGLGASSKLVGNKKSVIVIEKEDQVGGISKTKEYKGYRFDLGGHRFFTKAKEVNELWHKTLGKEFLKRPRLSRIYYRNKFFDYPVKAVNALKNLGLIEAVLILSSYIKIKIFPYKEEKTFEQWVTNRFGKRLFNHFFKSYTEKLWGIPCSEIQAEWAAQRIKGLSLLTAVKNAILPDRTGKIKTLIDEFEYPKYGPGMMYEKMAENIKKAGGNIQMETEVVAVNHKNSLVKDVLVKDKNSKEVIIAGEWFLSSMPLTELVEKLSPKAPKKVLDAAKNLTYRSFITISVILKAEDPFPDTWIYIHSPEVKMGRIQNFKAWSPYMVPDKNKIALGLEYFCTEGDEFWNKTDKELIKLGMTELEKIGLGKSDSIVDGFVIRVPKAYPVYDSEYPKHLKTIREYLSTFKNLQGGGDKVRELQPIGRYGMFKYNNMDHSILTGLYAAENILGANYDIWEVNADQEYHEEKK